jgi:glucosamine-6-phosphate deaminase
MANSEKVNNANDTKEFFIDKLHVHVYQSRVELGRAAAAMVADRISSLLNDKEEINMIFAAAPSQSEFLEELIRFSSIDWTRINAFHMDEYIGIPSDAPQRFGNFLKQRLFDKVPFKSVYYIDPEDPEKECIRYSGLLQQYPSDIVCLGIGENGHLAFNDPPVADFDDPKLVKIVELDHACRQQQVNDGCFSEISEVPKQAITLTIPALLSARFLCCVVPGKSKAMAVSNTLYGPVSTSCPASILRRHSGASLFLDSLSYTSDPTNQS